MTRHSPFGLPLTDEAKQMVNDVRLKIGQPIHPNDVEHIPSFDGNPIFQKRLMPRGEILEKTDNQNRLLWYIEYATITVESIAHSIRSSEACKFQFLQFEYMLRKVMEQEERTGCLSSLRHIVNMDGYEINPFTMVFVTSGTLAYYSQLFHFENYPELVTPVDMVNIAKWIHVPYKIAKAMMPTGFSEKFRLHDRHFIETLTEDINIDDIPVSLGGNDAEITFTGAIKIDPNNYWRVDNADLIDALEGFHVGARKNRHVVVNVTSAKDLKWYFSTDGDIYFGIFFEGDATNNNVEENEPNLDSMEMVYPWLKITAKLVHEIDGISMNRIGKYHIVFCNKHSWIHRRCVQFYGQIHDNAENTFKRLYTDGTMSNAEKMF